MTARKTVSRSKKAITLRKNTSTAMQIKKTRVFQSGNSRAIRLPKDFHLNVGPVYIYQWGDNIIIRQAPITIGDLWDLMPKFPADVKLEIPAENTVPEKDVSWD